MEQPQNAPSTNPLTKTASLLIIITLVIIGLVYAQEQLVPIVLALFLWFIVKTIVRLLNRIPFIENKIPSWLSNILAFGLIILFCFLAGQMLYTNIEELSESLPLYEANINYIIEKINMTFMIDLKVIAKNTFKDFDFTNIVMSLINALTNIFGDTFMIVLYTLFMLSEEALFTPKLKAIASNKESYSRVKNTLSEINESIGSYITLKSLVSLLTAFLSFLALSFIGVDAPVFWAFLIFVLNFIPTIGSLIATGFPAIFALLQFGDYFHPLLVLGVVGAIQLIVGNMIEPRVMGNSLNISPLVVIIALSIWGAIWGINGMILSVPITVIAIIIFSKIPSTQSIAILLSEKGKLNNTEIADS